MSRQLEKPRVVLLGGGNGTSRMLSALVPMLEAEELASLHALVLNADDGGSTGRLREQYDVAAVGDITRCLMALSGFHDDVRGEQFLKALDHRFEGGDFTGHTLRNIFLTSLEMASDIDDGIAMMARLLQVPKDSGVVPVTLDPLTQQVVITFNGQKRLLGAGQHFISHNVNLQADPRWQAGDVRVQFEEEDAVMNPRAEEVLRQATHVIVAPGHTYGTILPTLATPKLGELLQGLDAQLWFVMGLLTTPRQTEGWSGEDFVRVYESYLGRGVDVVMANTKELPMPLVAGQAWVRFDEAEHNYELHEGEMVDTTAPAAGSKSDVVPRAVVVHEQGHMQKLLKDFLLR